MKIAPLLVASATALETSTSATALLAAVGKRNVTHMENLIQGLAEESVKQPAWKFDQDISDALEAIRSMFVKSIQTALRDQHKVDQETHNTATKDCYSKCGFEYEKSNGECEEQKHACYTHQDHHRTCRLEVYQLYRTMAISCAELHCFEPPKPECQYEDCICPDLLNCHTGHTGGGDDYGDDKGYKTASLSMWCEATKGECKSKGYGDWLLDVANLYEAKYDTWHKLWTTCSAAYQAFLLADVKCDGVQKEFEKCMCEVDYTKNSICSNDFKQCSKKCWEIYEEEVPKLQCMEKDRKIDWSATKKIECYLDVLLYKYTEQQLIDECGSKDCVNVAREADYKKCATICPMVDFHGEWAEPICDLKPPHRVYFEKGHLPRKELDQYHLGDHQFYANDMNGEHVHTDHRSLSVDRLDEMRCTEHLDIDFQVPPMLECKICDPEHESCEVCDDAFHCLYYEEFDRTDRIGCIKECCPDDHDDRTECFPEGWLTSCTASLCDETGKNCEAAAYDDTYPWVPSTKRVSVREHTHIWAYNRCECTRCPSGGGYDSGWEAEYCVGAHTLNLGGDYGEH